MTVYQQIGAKARTWITDAYIYVCDNIFGFFSPLTEAQKLIISGGLLSLLLYIAVRPPRIKRAYDDDKTDHAFVALSALLIGGFCTGLMFYPVPV